MMQANPTVAPAQRCWNILTLESSYDIYRDKAT